MSRHYHLFLFLCLPLLGCSRFEFTVGKKKSKSSSEMSSDAMPQAHLYSTWNSMEDYASHLDELKKDGADALLKIYREDGRHRIRLGFRRFRDAIIRDATHDDSTTLSPWSHIEAGSCKNIDKTDLFDLGGYGDLRSLIDTSFLGKLSLDHASAFNPQLPQQLDEVTKLAFFEFGINLEGQSSYVQKPLYSLMQTAVDWQVIHEQQEESSWITADEQKVRFTFKRQVNANGDQILEIGALVSSNLVECSAEERLPAMTLRYVKRVSGSQHLFLKKGFRSIDGSWLEVKVSRRISILQDIKQGELLTLIDTQRFDLPGESSRSFSVSIKDLEICSVKRHGDVELPRDPEQDPIGELPPHENVDHPQQNEHVEQDNPNQSGK